MANKVLQITGGGSTTLYYDPCTDNTKLGNYTTIIRGEGGNCTTTWVEYDSTENAMKLTNCDNKTKSLQISALDGLNNFTLEADIKLGGSSSQSFECGFAITNSTTALCGIMLQRTSNFTTFNYHNQGWDGETNATSHSDFIGEWTHLKVTVEDLDITVEVTNVNGVKKSFTKSLNSSYYTANSMQFGICLASDYSQHSWIKNIKAETIGGGGSTTIFEDVGSASGVNNYNETHLVETTGDTNFTLVYDTTYNAYHLTTNSSKAVQLTFSALNGITDDFRLTVDMMTNGGWIALCYLQYTQTGFFYGGNDTRWEGHRFQNGNWQQTLNSTGSCSIMTWYTIELIKEDTTITVNCWDITKTTKYATYSREYTDGDNFYGIVYYSSECYFKNIKAEYLNPPSPTPTSDCSQYTTQIANAIEYINGSGS